jgi:glycosyltransferase involved in cell wall biosynthesis
METSPAVSVIIPTHNRADFIGETLASVCAQTFPDFEVIVADDGSTDNTKEVVTSLGDTRIRYFWQPQSGGLPARVRNKAIGLSRGRYIAFLDSDDLWLPNKLEIQVPYMEAHPEVGFVFTNSEGFSSTKEKWRLVKFGLNRKATLEDLLRENFIPMLTVLVRRTCLETVGGLCEDPAVNAIEDYELWLRLATRYPFQYIPVLTARYRVHGKNLQATDMIASTQRLVTVVRRFEKSRGIPRKSFRRGLAAHYRRLARAHALAGNKEEYIRALIFSWECYPDWKTGTLLVFYNLIGFNLSRRTTTTARQLKATFDQGLWWLQSKALEVNKGQSAKR